MSYVAMATSLVRAYDPKVRYDLEIERDRLGDRLEREVVALS